MQFQQVRDAIIDTLGADSAALPAANQFRVIGYQRQAEDAVSALNQTIQVFYNAGDFPKSGGSFIGDSIKHKPSFRIEMTVASKTKGNLSGLESATTPAEASAALATFFEASSLVDTAMDQLWSNVWNILMDAKNETFSLPIGAVSSRWVNGFQKDNPTPKGEIVLLTANAVLSCDVDEEVIGVTGATGLDFDITLIDINGDTEQKTGVSADIIPGLIKYSMIADGGNHFAGNKGAFAGITGFLLPEL
jgi:hypothetical protein